MKNLLKILFVAFLVTGIAACSKEEGGVSVENAGKTYVTFTIQLPTTRSATDDEETTNSDADPDFEVGYDTENKITTVQLALVNANDDKIIAVSLRGTSVAAPEGQPNTQCVAFQSEDLLDAAGDSEIPLKVIAWCNHYSTTVVKGQSWTTAAAETVGADIDKIAVDNNFWMTNADKNWNDIKLPTKTEISSGGHDTPENAIPLGQISVERTAARFDYAANETRIFPVQKVTQDDKTTVNIELTQLAMFNISEDCYKLRRVSANGKNENWDLFGKETLRNYVVDTDAAEKTKKPGNPTLDNLTWTNITDISTADNWNGTQEYFFWRYGVENTIPEGVPQTKNIATGILFKGKIVATDDYPELKTAMENKNPIYVYDNVLYGPWNHVVACQDTSVVLSSAVAQVIATYNQSESHEQIDENSDAWKAALASVGFVQYTPTTAGDYELYYKYYNRHNDNGDPKKSGPMEFAVVRNNVYKLKVTEITGYGKPDVNFDDPDPIEKEKIWFKVCVKVLPWVVRVNDIALDPTV